MKHLMDISIQTLSFELANRSKRPIFRFSTGSKNVNAFIDSGATVPVWVDTELSLLKAYPNATLWSEKAIIKGYGKDSNEEFPVYIIPDFVLSNSECIYTIHNLCVIVCPRKRNIGCQFIMSDTMFPHADYSFCRITEQKHIEISFIKKEWQCTVQKHGQGTISAAVWAQV